MELLCSMLRSHLWKESVEAFDGQGMVLGRGFVGEAMAKAALISPSAQLVWLLRELVKSGVLGADGVCMTFMKQIAGKLCCRSKVTTACTRPARASRLGAVGGVQGLTCGMLQLVSEPEPVLLCSQVQTGFLSISVPSWQARSLPQPVW